MESRTEESKALVMISRFEEGFWTLSALLCTVAAILQAMLVADRISQIGWMAYKFGFGPQLITAGSTTIGTFFVISALLIGFGILIMIRLRVFASPFYPFSFFSVVLLVTSTLVWGGLLASPLIKIVER